MDQQQCGLAVFAYLRRLPMHELKLAGSFALSLCPPDSDLVAERIVATLVNLAHALELTITAKSVETDLQLHAQHPRSRRAVQAVAGQDHGRSSARGPRPLERSRSRARS
ncbi:MAG: hypothetical protein ACRDTA_01530 [Pseudonocardiaceae bacterium]